MNGHINILRVSSNREGDFIEIQVTDKKSGNRFIEVRMTMTDFAFALTGMGHTPCEFEVCGLELIGKVREHKTEVLPAIDKTLHSSCREAAARQTVSRYEHDGWLGHWQDMLNWHNAVKLVDGRDGRRVSFVRYVNAPSAEGEIANKEVEIEEWRRDIADSQGH